MQDITWQLGPLGKYITVLVEPSRESWYCYPRCMTVDNAAIADDCEQPQSERGNALKLRGKKEKSTARWEIDVL